MPLNFFDYLQNIGISHKEITVYIYLLSVEMALPMEIAKQTKLKRSTVYMILDLLKQKGLVREIQKGRRFSYVAEDPDRIKFLLEEMKLQTERSIQTLDDIMPQIKAVLRRAGEPPLIKFFEGDAAVQASLEDLVSNPRFKTDLDYGIFPIELVYKLFNSNKLRKFISSRITDNKHFKIIYTSEEGEIPTKLEHNQEAFRVDQNEYPFSCDISIFEDEVRIHMFGKTIYGILIKSAELANTLVSVFKLAGKGAQIQEQK